jgi:hypothetical protein
MLWYIQFHPSFGITPLEQVQNLDHGNLSVLQEKFGTRNAKKVGQLHIR